MKVTTVTAHYERKKNLGNYNSMTLSTWATVELESDDTPAAALDYAMALCRMQLSEAHDSIMAGDPPAPPYLLMSRCAGNTPRPADQPELVEDTEAAQAARDTAGGLFD